MKLKWCVLSCHHCKNTENTAVQRMNRHTDGELQQLLACCCWQGLAAAKCDSKRATAHDKAASQTHTWGGCLFGECWQMLKEPPLLLPVSHILLKAVIWKTLSGGVGLRGQLRTITSSTQLMLSGNEERTTMRINTGTRVHLGFMCLPTHRHGTFMGH